MNKWSKGCILLFYFYCLFIKCTRINSVIGAEPRSPGDIQGGSYLWLRWSKEAALAPLIEVVLDGDSKLFPAVDRTVCSPTRPSLLTGVLGFLKWHHISPSWSYKTVPWSIASSEAQSFYKMNVDISVNGDNRSDGQHYRQ